MSRTEKKMYDLFKAARKAGVPIVSLATTDQAGTVDVLRQSFTEWPMVQWDAVRGVTPVNKQGERAQEEAGINPDDTIDFVLMLRAVHQLPEKTVVFVHNAHRQLQSMEPNATAQAVQGVANLRDDFKMNYRTLVLLGPYGFDVPHELDSDVMPITHELPGLDELTTIVSETYDSLKELRAKGAPSKDVISKGVDAVSGQSAFSAEQITAVSLSVENGLDHDSMWDRARVQIERTPGLKVYRGGETLDDLRGLANVKSRLRQFKKSQRKIDVVVWIDEGADVFSEVEHDTSGVKTDQQRGLLTEMEANGWGGVMLVGVPGSGKSALARAFGNELGVLTLAMDLGGMESKYVGESEQNFRRSIEVIKRIGQGNAFFILTANSLKGIRPQFQARFRRGTFYFDPPTREEREAIWQYFLKKYNVKEDPKKNPRPNDEGWVGREIREAVESAWDLGTTLAESAQYIVPVTRSRWQEIEAMRKEADGKFLSASEPGVYHYKKETENKPRRAMDAALSSAN